MIQSGGSHVSDNDPEVLEREKERNIKGQQHHTSTPHKHAPGWNESLASVSEAAVKADQAENVSPEELQKITIEYITKRHKEKVDGEVIEETTVIERDEVRGPLRSAGRK